VIIPGNYCPVNSAARGPSWFMIKFVLSLAFLRCFCVIATRQHSGLEPRWFCGGQRASTRRGTGLGMRFLVLVAVNIVGQMGGLAHRSCESLQEEN